MFFVTPLLVNRQRRSHCYCCSHCNRVVIGVFVIVVIAVEVVIIIIIVVVAIVIVIVAVVVIDVVAVVVEQPDKKVRKVKVLFLKKFISDIFWINKGRKKVSSPPCRKKMKYLVRNL